MKFIHTADIHLGSAFYQLDENKAQQRRNELLTVFRKIVDIAKTENADALLIAGDLFDNNDAIEEAKYVNHFFAEIPNTAVLISAGNHDWNIYSKIIWNKNVHIFTSMLERVCVKGIYIYGASFSGIEQKQSLLSDMPAIDQMSILVMHGQVGSGDYNPMSIEQLSPFCYCALGHIHKYQGILQNETGIYAYSGFPEPRGFDEMGEGGIVIGDIDANGTIHARRVATSIRQYIKQTVDISLCKNNLDVVDLLHKQIQPQNIYQFQLKKHNNHFDLSVPYILSCLKNFCFDLQIDVEESEDYDKLSRENSLRGAFVRAVLQHSNLTEEQKMCILQFGLHAMGEGHKK